MTVNGAELAFEDLGEGPPLLLIHAGICDRRMWRPQVSGWAARHRLLAPDLRGFGQSSLPPGPFRHADDLLVLLDELGIERVAVVGVSMGGEVALDLALAATERITALVLCATRAAAEQAAPEIVAVWQAVDELLERGKVEAANELELRAWVDGPERAPEQVDPAVRALVAEMNCALLRRALEPGAELATEMKSDPPRYRRLAKVGVPTLVVSGALDQPEVNASCRRLAREIPHAHAVEIEGAAHLPSLERPELFNPEVERFLTRL
jgi:pimeloyl-ACP methyl ester carboxylesterase